MLPILTRDEWIAKRHDAPGAMLRKSLLTDLVEAAPEVDTRTLRFTITTGAVDRDNDTVNPKGWKTANYLKNPVFLWAHDYSQLPIGKAIALEMTGDRLVASVKFADHPMAEAVYRLYKDGFMSATSVGFQPLKVVENEERRGYDFVEQDLLEFSAVPVPANPEALIEARSAGVDMTAMQTWAEAVIKGLKADSPAPEPDPAPAPDPTPDPNPAPEPAVEAPEPDPVAAPVAEAAAVELVAPVEAAFVPDETAQALAVRAVEVALSMEKRGRVLSAANEGLIRQASDLLNSVLAQLAAVERADEPDEDEDEDEDHEDLTAEGTSKGLTLTLAEDEDDFFEVGEDDDDIIEFDTDSMKLALAGVLAGAVAAAVKHETRRALDLARGRVD